MWLPSCYNTYSSKFNRCMVFAIKRALKLNNSEATLMAKHAGFRRVVYNMGLSLRTQMYGEPFKCGDSKIIDTIKKVLTNYVKKRPEFSWMNELSSRVYQHALIDLKSAFSRYRKGVAKHPRYASRKDGQSFTVDNGGGKSLIPCGSTIKIPTLGTFRLHEPLTEGYAIQTFNIVREGDRWYVSFCVEAERLPVSHPQGSVGIDVGVSVFATLSSGETFDAPKPLKQAKTARSNCNLEATSRFACERWLYCNVKRPVRCKEVPISVKPTTRAVVCTLV